MSSRLTAAALSVRYRHATFGKGIRFNGRPLFRIDRTARVHIGVAAKFTSKPAANLVGLSRRSTIYVGPNAELIIGDHCGFSAVSIYCSTRISIGDHLTCGGNVSLWDTDFHPLEATSRRKHEVDQIRQAPIEIGDDVFIGAESLVLKGARIGARSVVGAGSVVTGVIPPDEVWAGNPIRRIRHRELGPPERPQLSATPEAKPNGDHPAQQV